MKTIKAIDKPVNNKVDRPDRTIETMFRITSNNSQRLSDQADTKSHIMISVNALIVSILLTSLFRQMQQFPHLTIPLLMLVSVNILTIIFSILATQPNIPKGSFTLSDLKEKKTNLLFFGNFYKMNFEDYCGGMLHVMNDRQFLYQSLLRDIYCQGVVLGKKYKMLKRAYNIFMYGLILSVVAFVVSSLINQSQQIAVISALAGLK